MDSLEGRCLWCLYTSEDYISVSPPASYCFIVFYNKTYSAEKGGEGVLLRKILQKILQSFFLTGRGFLTWKKKTGKGKKIWNFFQKPSMFFHEQGSGDFFIKNSIIFFDGEGDFILSKIQPIFYYWRGGAKIALINMKKSLNIQQVFFNGEGVSLYPKFSQFSCQRGGVSQQVLFFYRYT